MASVFKRGRDRGKRGACWQVAWMDENGKRRTRKAFTDKGLSEQLAHKLEQNARLLREGLIESAEDALFLEKRRPLAEHLVQFERHLKNRDVTPKRISELVAKIRRIIEGCGFECPADINATAVEDFLAALREEGIGKQTSNHYLGAMQQFQRWMIRTQRTDENPLADIPQLNVQTDRRHDRRPLSEEEFLRLIAAAEAAPSIESVSGPDRAMMYVLSAWTGYRKGEIGSLTLRSFDLHGDPPTVTVQAVYSKRKRTDTQVLHPDVLARFLEWLASKGEISPDELLFPVSGKVPGGKERKTSTMMKRDLDCARKPSVP